jgi:CheY-like chemotaxis protein/HPt (histidine-containing phosphotransfer) domain-containing protein
VDRWPKIILVTAYDQDEAAKEVARVQLDGLLVKPVSSSSLFNGIVEAFDGDRPKGGVRTSDRVREGDRIQRIAGARLLVVEDNPTNQQVAREILEAAGFRVDMAGNGQDALTALDARPYDAVLMDIQMPVMDGYTAAREIRKADRFRDLPIIAMTAHAMAGDARKSLDAGMQDHVTKPIDPQRLLAVIERWVPPQRSEKSGDRNAPPGATHVERVEDDGEASLPQNLPGFDLAAGLNRLQSNRQLYRKLLVDFERTYADAVSKIRENVAAGAFSNVHARVHSLKGVAGNLEARPLLAAAVTVEKQIKALADGDAPPPELDAGLDHLAAMLNQAVAAVRSLDLQTDSHREPASEMALFFGERIAPELARETAARLHKAAEMGDIAELRAIAEGLAVQAAELVPIGRHIATMVDHFDLEGILKLSGILRKSALDNAP